MKPWPLVLALAACGGGEDAVTVCDGSADLRLAIRYLHGAAFAPGERVLYQNGESYLFVDGTCTYHVKTGGRWEDVVRGTADDAVLVDDLELAELPTRAGAYTGELDDAPILQLAFAGDTITCDGGCRGDLVPDWLISLNAHVAALLTSLRAEGFTQTFPQRLLVIDQAVPPTPAFLWPASFAPDTIAILPADDTTPPTLVDAQADAAALRELRRAVRDAQFPPAAAYITTDAAEPPAYAAFLRDVVPFEDADGFVPDPD